MTGSGTESDPYVIYNVQDLQDVNNHLSAYYVLANDIDCSGFDFVPIGEFTGNFDGKNHKILNLSIDNGTNTTDAGLFSDLTDAIVKNIVFENSYIKGENSDYVGTLSGYVYNSDVLNIKVINGQVIGYLNAGGIVCIVYIDTGHHYYQKNDFQGSIDFTYNEGSINDNNFGGNVDYLGADLNGILDVSCCSAEGNVEAHAFWSGGFVGQAESFSNGRLNIKDCNANFGILGLPPVSGYTEHIGGFAGYFNSFWSSKITVERCESYGDIEADNGVGGFVGYVIGYGTNEVSVKNCYSRGNVKLREPMWPYGAGFIAYYKNAIIENCYSTGKTLDEGFVFGPPLILAGFSGNGDTPDNTIHCYWDIETSETTDSFSGEGKTTAEMQTKSTFVNWSDKVWKFIANHYPTLIEQCKKFINMGFFKYF